MKQEKIKYDFKAFGQAIKEARKAKGIWRNQLANQMNIDPRYIASIENNGQHPSLQIFYELVTLLDVSVDQFFFQDSNVNKSTQRRQLDSLLDEMESKDLIILTATVKGIQQAKSEEGTEN
ncbi:helix-turn-helix transcriptional regulator [Anaerotignum propionicum]|uniref:helix-turn-helix transcriptional regulator n=1 Tax=Anaerotignum propionicum TaxID=28446 RepID=UPI002899A596|nr:helix-turn-helix transcriptional regulator [Anaerotignum propionicum]